MDIREETKPLDIITDYEKLSERSIEVATKKDGKKIMQLNRAMKATIRENPSIKGIAGIQVGEPIRVCNINFGTEVKCFVNPMISKAEGVCLSRETTESLPGRTFIAIRNNDIEVKYQEPNGRLGTSHLVGQSACIMQQMIDYMQGTLLEDHALEIDDDFDNATDEEKEQIIKAYCDSLDLHREDLMKEIQQDAETKQLYDGIDFMEKVQSGEVKLTQQTFDVVKPTKQKKPRITKKKKIV